ncbi:XRE family transcriptional regulator [Legionella fairfieldensis]|uniref:XRE family transcriptional regulator n=1 Tax=Legionella fairfieldensis TaxID=45064 RepID=UPI00048B5646|nr:XRE family transcriptional regulator [Legionella fairfieldensis]
MNKYIGSSFDEFLEEENLLADTSAEAIKRVLAWQIKTFLETNHMNKKTFAEKMKTSRSQLDRLLDPANTNLSLKTLVSTANAMGKHVEIRIID